MSDQIKENLAASGSMQQVLNNMGNQALEAVNSALRSVDQINGISVGKTFDAAQGVRTQAATAIENIHASLNKAVGISASATANATTIDGHGAGAL